MAAKKFYWAALLGLIIILGFLLFQRPADFIDDSASYRASGHNSTCPITKKIYTVRGESMSPLLREGQDITGLLGYYACHKVERGDIILYELPGKENFIVKKVVGIPGDSFAVQEGGISLNWNIIINGSLLGNSAGAAYTLDEQHHKILSLYERDYAGEIPGGAYILFGDALSGSLDSTQFGFAQKSRIMGKVEPQ